jgi:hypothetical protein
MAKLLVFIFWIVLRTFKDVNANANSGLLIIEGTNATLQMGQVSLSASSLLSSPQLRIPQADLIVGGTVIAQNSIDLVSVLQAALARISALENALMRAGSQHGFQLFNQSGQFSFTVPPNVTQIRVSASGGGGGGCSCYFYGGGGAATIYNVPLAVSPGQTIAITIGAGGVGGPALLNFSSAIGCQSSAVGSSGGPTTIGVLPSVTLNGGGGGLCAVPGAPGGDGGQPGYDVGGDTLLAFGGPFGLYSPIRTAGFKGQGWGADGGSGAQLDPPSSSWFFCYGGGPGADGAASFEW